VPLTPADVAAQKRTFLWEIFGLDRPQVEGWTETALRDATTASSRRARLYHPGLTPAQRTPVRAAWWGELKRIADAYVANGPEFSTQAQFENDVTSLKSFMNERFGAFFRSANGPYAAGFRIAHAQKSLSLLLKHYWCNDLMEEPPCCPVDRRILICADDKQPRWTDIDTLTDYRAKLNWLKKASENSPLAPISLPEWELWAFNPK
jgi:hypothetical protein